MEECLRKKDLGFMVLIEGSWKCWRKKINESKMKGRYNWMTLIKDLGLKDYTGGSYVYVTFVNKDAIYIGESDNSVSSNNRFLGFVVQYFCFENGIEMDKLIKHTPFKKCIEEYYSLHRLTDDDIISILVIKTDSKPVAKTLEQVLLLNCYYLNNGKSNNYCRCNREYNKKGNET